MKMISLWAKYHPLQARFYIVIIKIALIFIAIFLSKQLLETGVYLPPLLNVFFIFFFVLAAIFYPGKRPVHFSKNSFYYFRKSFDWVLGATTFLFMCTIANNNASVFIIQQAAIGATSATVDKSPTAEEILASLKYRDKSSLTKQEKRILKKEFGRQLKIYAKAKMNGDKDGGKAVAIIFVIIAAVGLTLLLAALSCSIACGGAEGLAFIVALVGIGGLVWGTVALVRRIKRGPKIKKQEDEPEPVTVSQE